MGLVWVLGSGLTLLFAARNPSARSPCGCRTLAQGCSGSCNSPCGILYTKSWKQTGIREGSMQRGSCFINPGSLSGLHLCLEIEAEQLWDPQTAVLVFMSNLCKQLICQSDSISLGCSSHQAGLSSALSVPGGCRPSQPSLLQQRPWVAVPAHTHAVGHTLWSGVWYIFSTVFLTENADCIFCHCFTWAQSCNSIDLGPNPAHLKMSLHWTFD